MKKKIIGLMIVAMLASVGTMGCSSQKTEQTNDVAAVAVVDGESITENEFDAYVEFQKKGAESSGQITPEMWTENAGKGKTFEQELKTATLDYMVTQEILLQAAAEAKIEVKDEAMNSELEKIKSSFEDESQYKEYLEKMAITEDYMKELIKNRLIINQYLESSVVVDDEGLKAYYEENKPYFDKIRASHILINVEKDENGNLDETSKAKAFDKITDIQKRIADGEAFDVVAKAESEGPSKDVSGDLGYFGKGQMVKEFEDVAFGLETGVVSEPVLTSFGYHLIKVTDRKMDFESNQSDVKNLYTQKMYSEKMQELSESAKVEKLASFENVVEESKGAEATEASEEAKTDENAENETKADETSENSAE